VITILSIADIANANLPNIVVAYSNSLG